MPVTEIQPNRGLKTKVAPIKIGAQHTSKMAIKEPEWKNLRKPSSSEAFNAERVCNELADS